MPWTPRQVRYLESSGSPLSPGQKDKMNAELHADPSLGHHKKGSPAMKHNIRRMEIEVHRGPKNEVTGHTIYHHMMPSKASKSGAFMEQEQHAYPFDADGQSSTHGDMMEHIGQHLKLEGAGEHHDAEAPQHDETDGEY
jgi:hypothetical protein